MSVLMLVGICEILIIFPPPHRRLLGDGSGLE